MPIDSDSVQNCVGWMDFPVLSLQSLGPMIPGLLSISRETNWFSFASRQIGFTPSANKGS